MDHKIFHNNIFEIFTLFNRSSLYFLKIRFTFASAKERKALVTETQ